MINAKVNKHLLSKEFIQEVKAMAKTSVVKDMTIGNETRLLINFMLPMLVGNIFQQLYNIADSIIVGQHVGSDSLGAIGCTAPITFLFFSICQGIGMGAGIMVAQYFGAGNKEQVKKTLTNSFYIVALSGILLSVLGVIFTRPVLELLGTPTNQLEDAVKYMHITCAGTIAVAIYNYASQVMRALGDAKTPLYFIFVATILNVLLDLYFIIDLEMGVEGAAYATIIAQGVSAIGSLITAAIINPYFKLEKAHFELDIKLTKLCLKVGLPLGMQGFAIAISCVILQAFVNSFDENVVTAFTVTSRVEQFVQQPYSSLAMAVSTFTGQNMGAGQEQRVRRALHRSVAIVGVISIVMLVVCFGAGELIIRCFVDDLAVIKIGTMGLKIISIMFFPLGIIYVTRGLLNGANDSTYAFINGGIEVTGRILFSVLMVFVAGAGQWSVWLATGLTWLLAGTVGVLRYKQNIWVTKSITEERLKA